MKTPLLLFFWLFSIVIAYAQPKLVKDINTSTGNSMDSNPKPLITIGNTMYFIAYTQYAGEELWKTTGTSASTVMVKDIREGTLSSNVRVVGKLNNLLIFSADNGTHGRELWKTDGTEAGTVMIKDIWAGGNTGFEHKPALSPSTALTNFFAFAGNHVFFMANDGIYGSELWKSDGTTAGTVLVKDINPGIGDGCFLIKTTPLNGQVFIAAGSSLSNHGLWKTDGTEAGTVMLTNTLPIGQSRYFINSVIVNNTLFFMMADPNVAIGLELWKSDGTTAGTILVKNTNITTQTKPISNLTVVNNALFFTASDEENGSELWKMDGTEVGTGLLKDIRPGAMGSTPSLMNVNGTLFIIAYTDAFGRELWKSDGTSAGTVLVKDIYPGTMSSDIYNLVNVNGMLYFTASSGTMLGGTFDYAGKKLWRSDGTTAGTVMFEYIAPEGYASTIYNPLYLTYINGNMYFQYSGEPWKSNGTATGTVKIKEIQPDQFNGIFFSSDPMYFTELNGVVLFSAKETTHGQELWRTDGTEAGTTLVKNIAQTFLSSSPSALKDINGTLFFTALGEMFVDAELWKTNGTATGTVRVKDIYAGTNSSNPYAYTAYNGSMFFRATTATATYGLWKTDGTDAGTVFVKNMCPGTCTSLSDSQGNIVQANNLLFLTGSNGTNGKELFKSDGTPAGTVMVKDLNIGSGDSDPANFTVFGNKVLFTASTQGGTLPNSKSLWISDGTEAGTILLKTDLYFESGSNNFKMLDINGTVFFTAYTEASGYELWKTNGNQAGTLLVKDIIGGQNSSNPIRFQNLNGTLIFSSNAELWRSDGTDAGTFKLHDNGFALNESVMNGALFFNGNGELWKTNGTEAGTLLVKEIFAGSNRAEPQEFFTFNNTLFFRANNGTHGYELWKSNGTEAGTTMVKDLKQGIDEAKIKNFMNVNGVLIFLLENGITGNELWKTDGTEAGTVSMMGNIVLQQIRNFCVTGNSLFFSAYRITEGAELWNLLSAPLNSQTINFPAIAPKAFNDPPFQLNPTSSQSLPITYVSSNPQVATVSGNTVTILSVGSTVITASQEGNFTTSAASQVSQTLTVDKSNQTISFNALPAKTFGNAPFNLQSTTTSNLTTTYTSSNLSVATVAFDVVTIVGVGSTVITATQVGNNSYKPAEAVEQTLTVNKANQNLTFPAIADKVLGDSPFALSATSNAGLAVSYTLSTTPATGVATLSGNTLTIVGMGSVSVTASQIGNANYQPAPNVVQTFSVLYPTSLSSNIVVVAIEIYPNPSKSGIYEVRGLQSVDKNKVAYTVVDAAGKEIMRGTWAGKDNETLNLSESTKGIYTLFLQGSKTQAIKKIIK